jgi:uncharacterized protein with HEPN domain
VEGIDRDRYLRDTLIQRAVAMSLVTIGEAVAKLLRINPDFVMAHPEIPWGAVVGMRNRIAHGYYGLDFQVIWDTIQDSIPDRLAKLSQASR